MVERDRSRTTLAAFATSLVALAIFVMVPVSPFAGARAPAAAQQAASGTDIWKGVFTDAQANRGKAVFQAHCASCHDPSEQGEAPPLSGDVFMRNWEGHSVGRLYSKIVGEMPANNPESVTSAQKLDVLTYILHENGFPSGAAPLSDESEALARIQIVPEGGPGAPRTGAMVVVVGCLGRAAPNEWRLTGSTEPVVTTLAPASAGEKEGAVKSLGTQTVHLLHVFPSPDAQQGHRIEAKGFLVRAAAHDLAINVVSLRSLAPACP